MRILLLTLYYEPDIGANAVIVSGLAGELARRGHQLTVVTGFPHYAKNELDPSSKGKLIATEELGNIRVIRTYLYASTNKASFLVRFLNYGTYNVLSTLAAVFSGPQDLVLAPSPPLTIGLTAALVSLIKQIPYVYNVQDINPDVLIKLGILKNHFVIRFSKWLEKYVYKHAEQITVLSAGFEQNLLLKGIPQHKLTIIPNFIDPDFMVPLEKENGFRERNQLTGKFVVLYAGNLGHSQNLEHLLICADSLQARREIVFLIVGNGSRKPFLEEYSNELGLANVLFLPFQPQEDIPLIYAAADLSLVTLKKGIALDSVPSKIYTIMASSRPVLAAVDPGSDAWKLVKQANCGVTIEPEDPVELKKAILDLKGEPALCSQMGVNGRLYVEEHHSKERIGQQYHDLFVRILHERGQH